MVDVKKLKQEYDTWEGVNKYIARDVLKKIKEEEKKEVVEKPKPKPQKEKTNKRGLFKK